MAGAELDHQALVGLYYADGHVRVYHGGPTELPRRYVISGGIIHPVAASLVAAAFRRQGLGESICCAIWNFWHPDDVAGGQARQSARHRRAL